MVHGFLSVLPVAILGDNFQLVALRLVASEQPISPFPWGRTSVTGWQVQPA
jgi:hypothetical protein